MKKLEAALSYASWGWHVLPVVQNGKIPATQHGVNDATTDQEKITRWWTQNPDYNIGIATGKLSRVVVFDIDPRNGGDVSWDMFTEEHGETPDGAMQITAGGGLHHVAAYDPDIRSCKLKEGVDLLSDGRYFIAYPSSIEGRTYEWESSSDPFDGIAPFDIPDAWKLAYQAIRKPEKSGNDDDSGDLIKGNRNNGLTSLGGSMRNFGMSQAEIFAALSIANETRCEMPLPSSELSQIVRSVCRYEPESDIAASVAIGSDAADAILSAVKAQDQDYFFTRATSYLNQPSPLKWVIKNWVPDYGVTMVYGESGCGKTFITLDMACHIAAGMNWNGLKTKPGYVVYMAGEGNYGLRQRIAAWCKHKKITSLDNLLISNKAIDMDSPLAAAEIISAVREITKEDVAIIFVDTLNNHMAGDENKAQDARAMMNAAKIVGMSLNAGICFNHHVGVSAEAKTRARGSSAWRASLDSQIMISKKDSEIKVICTKMKDTEEPNGFSGHLEQVPLGWIDEDGEEINGAVFSFDEEMEKKKPEKKESRTSEEIHRFKKAWYDSGAKVIEDGPFVSREDMKKYLKKTDHKNVSDDTLEQYLKPSKIDKTIGYLFNASVIDVVDDWRHGKGYVVILQDLKNTMILQKQ